MASKSYQCTRCSNSYIYKGGLTAHIRRKHPLPVEPKRKGKASKPDAPVTVSPLIVQDLISINTQELESLHEDEEEFFEAAEHLEHDVGVNASMVDWYNVNFESSFSNTGEFAKRTSVVIQDSNCEDCKVSSKTFDKQRELLAKQDKQLQDGLRIQKDRNDESKKLKSVIKSLEARLEETTNMLETVLEENTSEITTLKAELKTKTDLLEAVQSERVPNAPNKSVRKNNDVEVELEKCKVCGFSSKSKLVMNQHMESRHKGVKVFKCLMCLQIFNSKESFKQHKAMHQRELDVITFKHICKECNISFGCREEQLEHLLDKHRPRNYVPKSVHDTHPEECKNGKSCKWLKNGRCRYEHTEQPWKTVQPRRPRQLVTQQSLKKQPSQHQKQEVMQQGKKHQQIRQQQQVRQQQSR